MQTINPGDFVKVRLVGGGHMERIWAIVQSASAYSVKIRLDNHPINDQFHYGEELEIPPRFILEHYTPQELDAMKK